MSEHSQHEADYEMHSWGHKFAGLARTDKGSKASRGMSKQERRELAHELRQFPMFSRCSEADLDALIVHGQTFSLPANWVMVADATPADACYVITSGSARVLRGNQQLAELERGAVVGEMAVLTGSLRRATVTTTTRVTGLRVSNDSLVRLFHERPSLLDALRAEFEVRAARARRPFRPEPLSALA